MGTHYKGSPTERRALDAYIKLMRAANSVTLRMKTELTSYGLTWTQFAALEALLHLGPMTLKELGGKVLTSGGNLTLVADNLERDGLVERQRSTTDRRQIRLLLTAGGRQKINAIFPGHATHIADVMRSLTGAELDTLGELCKKLGMACRVDAAAATNPVRDA